ncbi:MAG: DNA polymerase III subunit delta [Myxococcales bacterium]|nr:DNA polymerase III subunit delta [Myxococcales bacterium]
MKTSELDKELAKGKIRPAYLLAGEEPLLRDDALLAVRSAVLDGSADDFNLDRLDGRSTSLNQLYDSVRALPVMAQRRLVILSEPETARGAAGKKIGTALAELVTELADQNETILVVTAAKVDKRLSWVKAFKAPAVVVDCAPPKGAKALASFIAEEASAQGIAYESGVPEMLADRIGPRLLMLRQELSKIALFAGAGERVSRDHVAQSTSHIAEESIWDLMDAIGDGRGALALMLLSRMVGMGAPAPVVLASLASHFRKLSRLRTGGVVPGPPFVVKKLQHQARRFTANRLLRCLEAIHDTDTALKGAGALPPNMALERLVVGLSG